MRISSRLARSGFVGGEDAGGGDRMEELSFCCKDSASADGFGRLRDTMGDKEFGGGLVEDVGGCGPGL